MKLKLLVGFYLSLWVTLGAALAYFGVTVGIPAWATAVTIFVVFFFVNGSLAYVFRSRQLQRQGESPPAYLNYLFQTHKVSEPIQFPAPIRGALGLIVVLGGALFVFAGGVIIFASNGPGFLIGGSLFFALGAAFTYVGYRVIRMNSPGRRLFGADREVKLPNHSLQPTPDDGAAERPR